VESDIQRLTAIRAARDDLDRRELGLIGRLRHSGATWADIATALGLSSRQAAQQRHQRLTISARAHRHARDLREAPGAAAIREAVAEVHRWIVADGRWDKRFRRAPLARATAEAALDAEPGALYDLASHLLSDLSRPSRAQLPKVVQLSAAKLRDALST
jgi:hypothetical protein